jgi:two-component system response regulator AtoC/two-component system nitrogen regulation response regulator NtrX
MLVGQSVVMQELGARVTRIARTTFTVLIEGESGAGKELVAREIHSRSPRHRGPFVAVNCAALVETLVEAELFGIEERTATGVRGRRGKFELADQGTLFLDEVGDLSPAAQAKLLRVLQDMTVERVGASGTHIVDTRVVAATNRGLHDLVAAGRFRADLYYRIAGVDVVVPPLRSRREDIPLLVEHFLRQHGRAAVLAVAPSAHEAMAAYDWPGNVRQLARALERAVALTSGPEITLADLPDAIRLGYQAVVDDVRGDDSLRAWSSRYVKLVLGRCGGNKRRACDVLEITYHTLQAHLDYQSRAPRGTPVDLAARPSSGHAEAPAHAVAYEAARP